MKEGGTKMDATSALRRWRLSHGLSLADVAGLSGFSSAHLSLVERGQRNLRPLKRVLLARRLGAAVGDLFPVEN